MAPALLLALTIVATGSPPQAAEQREAWMSCMTDYAQAESAGTKSAAGIAVEALAQCRPERAAYWSQLMANGATRQAADDLVGAEDHDAARMIIAFVDRSR